jgi:FkbM family methyltransferase
MKMIENIIDYRRTYKNWIRLGYYYKIKKSQLFTIELRNGEKLTVPKELVSIIKMLIKMGKSNGGFQFDLTSGIFTFPYDQKNVRIKLYADNKVNGEFTSFLGDYNFLQPIKDNTVIDIGMNIADSSIWFAINEASFVIGLEPYKYSYEMALANIEINDLKGKILPLHAGYGEDGIIEVEDKVSDIGSVLEEHKGGIKISLWSLSKLLEQYQDNISGELLLKMDCEGCEYNILYENESVLKKFSRIIIEYHNGYNELKTKLENSGFSVKYTKPHVFIDKFTNIHYVQGYLYAIRKD